MRYQPGAERIRKPIQWPSCLNASAAWRRYVGYASDSGAEADIAACRKWARSGHSTTSSALTR